MAALFRSSLLFAALLFALLALSHAPSASALSVNGGRSCQVRGRLGRAMQ